MIVWPEDFLQKLGDRFVSKVEVDRDTGCWMWQAGLFTSGYAQFWDGERNRRAHRYSYEQVRGEIPADLVLDHEVCDTPACVNPFHTVAKTSRENVMRGRGVAAVNASKTHCKHGHEFTPENTYRVGPDGAHRMCKTCILEQGKQRQIEAGWTPREPITHCPSGHEYTEENSAYYKGVRYCRECKRVSSRNRPKKPRPAPEHGSHRKYALGCRCDECREFVNRWARERYARKKQ